jgi:hypothetical protein
MVVGIAGCLSGATREAAGQSGPAAATYVGIERTIESIRQAWSKPGARPEPNADGWISLFDTLIADLQGYSRANDDVARLTALNRLHETSAALETVAWPPAAAVRAELNEWLRPRIRLAWARRRLTESLEALPPASDAGARANRTRWAEFVANDLGGALRDYDGARTVQQRQAALRRLHEVRNSLNNQNQGQRSQGVAWTPSWELEAAMNDLFHRPNIGIAADAATVAPIFEKNLVTSGPNTRKGYTTMVTAGPKTGFGLIPLDGGIGFYNSQSLVGVTPIHDFHQQLAQDRRGRMAAGLYVFGATTYTWTHITITAVITPRGLILSHSASHSIDAAIGAAPTAGGGLGRGLASLVGLNRARITELVREGALPSFRQQIPVEAAEETDQQLAVQQARHDAELRSKYLIGDDTGAYEDILIRQLSMSSRPEAIFAGGRFEWRGAPDQRGADTPRPLRLAATFEPGVTVDLHLGSVLTSAAGGIWRQDEVRSVQNLMIQTKAVRPGTPPEDAATVTKNVAFADYVKAVDAARGAHDERVQALRIARPPQPPEFTTDARGHLVVLGRDLQLDVPAPDRLAAGAMIGVPAKILRLKAPLVEVALSYQLDDTAPGSPRLKGRIQEFNPGPTGEVIAINDDESRGTPLSRFQSALVMTALVVQVRGQKIDVGLDEIRLPGFRIRSVSPMDASGWARLNLVATTDAPPQNAELARAVEPGPPRGPGTAAIPPTLATTPTASEDR